MVCVNALTQFETCSLVMSRGNLCIVSTIKDLKMQHSSLEIVETLRAKATFDMDMLSSYSNIRLAKFSSPFFSYVKPCNACCINAVFAMKRQKTIHSRISVRSLWRL